MKRSGDNILHSLMRLVAALALLLAFALPAVAQDAASPEATKDASATADDGAEDVTADDFPRVADDEETIYTVQRKAFLNKNKWEFALMFSALFNDRFVDSYSPVGSITYFFSENFGLELFGGYFFPNPSGARDELLERASLRPEFARLTQLMWAVGIGPQWIPIYGKLEVGEKSLGSFDFYLSAGFAVGQTRTECIAGTALDPNGGFDTDPGQDVAFCPAPTGDVNEVIYAGETFRPMGSFAGGVRFNFNNMWGLKFEVRDYMFSNRVFRPNARTGGDELNQPGSQRFSDTIRNNVYANIGITIKLGGEDN